MRTSPFTKNGTAVSFGTHPVPVLWLIECPPGGAAHPALVVYDDGAGPVNLTTSWCKVRTPRVAVGTVSREPRRSQCRDETDDSKSRTNPMPGRPAIEQG